MLRGDTVICRRRHFRQREVKVGSVCVCVCVCVFFFIFIFDAFSLTQMI